MRRVLLATIAAAIAFTAAPARAQESVDLVQGFVDALNDLADAGQVPFVWQDLPDSAGVTDEAGDVFTLDGSDPAFTPDAVDLLASSQFAFALPRDAFQALFGDEGLLDCARPEVSCPSYETSGRPFADGVFVVGFRLAGRAEARGGGLLTLAVLASDDDFPTFQDPRPLSPFVGTNTAWRLDLTADADTVSFLRVSTGPFEELRTDARVLLDGDRAWFLIPAAEFPIAETITGVRAHTFAMPQSNAAADEQVADVDGPAGTTAFVTPVGPSGELRLSPPAEESPSESPSPSPSPVTESPVTESPVPAESPVAAASESDLLSWILILLGVVAAILGAFLFFGWLRGRPKEDIGPPGPGHTVARTRPPPPTPASAPTPEPDDRAGCDWAVYYRTDTNTGRALLRPARGHECCVYTISVVMNVDRLDQTARGRRDGVAPGAPDQRLRIPAIEFHPHGLGAKVEASVRTGPAEDRSWMHGEGAAQHPTAVPPPRQDRAHEEPPEVTAHVAWVISNVVKVDLESDCPGHVNRYSILGAGAIRANADLECTYAGPPECPIEFTAAGWVQGKADIDLEYDLKHQLGSDPDELEPSAPDDTPFVPIADLHDHERRDRLHYEAADVGTDEKDKQDDGLWLAFHTGLVAEAGTIVPGSIASATGRVTALVGSTVEHGVTISGEMERVDCRSGPCCGHGACECAPALQLRFAGPVGLIEVDGKSYRLTPDPGPVGTGRAWTLG